MCHFHDVSETKVRVTESPDDAIIKEENLKGKNKESHYHNQINFPIFDKLN